MDELRMKNALRCQFGQGKKYCKHCPYYGEDGKCDIVKLSSDALSYIIEADQTVNMIQDQLAQYLEH